MFCKLYFVSLLILLRTPVLLFESKDVWLGLLVPFGFAVHLFVLSIYSWFALLFVASVLVLTIIDTGHYFRDLLRRDITAKPSDPIHPDVVRGRRVMSLQQAIELRLVYVLV